MKLPQMHKAMFARKRKLKLYTSRTIIFRRCWVSQAPLESDFATKRKFSAFVTLFFYVNLNEGANKCKVLGGISSVYF